MAKFTRIERGEPMIVQMYQSTDGKLHETEEQCRKHEAETVGLRDQFAMAAMQTMLAGGGYQKWEDIANDAYKIADAMIKERVK